MAKKQSTISKVLTSIFCFILGLAIGALGNIFFSLPDSYEIPGKISGVNFDLTAVGNISVEEIKEKDLSIHFMELGNKYTGDSTLIKVGDTEVLIDAGSKASSIPAIKAYVDRYCTDGVLEYVIVTHAHEDHYAGFATGENTDSLFDLYEVEVIIDFAKTNKSSVSGADGYNKMYANYVRERQAEIDAGAKWFTALDCINGEARNGHTASKTFDLGNGADLEILNHRYYTEEAHSENDYSVCAMVNQNDKHYLFTGDLEADGEASLVALNSLPKVDVYKAGHHGSKTSSTSTLLSVIEPKVVCVCCCAGSDQYTSKLENQFPTQIFINNVAEHTDKVFVTTLCTNYDAGKYESFNGNIVVFADNNTQISVKCSNNDTILKDTEWFKNNRKMPESWAAA